MRKTFFLVALVVIGCKPPAEANSAAPVPVLTAPTPVAPTLSPSSPVAPARAIAAAGALKGELKAALEDAMKVGGPVGAIDVCKDKGQSIAAAHTKEGLAVGRTSHKLRNPANAPRPWVQPLLDEMVKSDPTTLTARTIALEGGRVGYVEPIVTGQLCLACHEAITPVVQAKLAGTYPNDAATGFKLGELRGVVWVEMTASQ
ncbi:MAG: DUF3365 domain-containing protein [Deltaproteobacteria bacterium]|nr:DUF3365 domain-containing protein [Deltaproteobacteria bacterium]